MLAILVTLYLVCYSTPASLTLGKEITQLHEHQRIQLTSAIGPESIVFDSAGEGPYSGVSDGRILKWKGPLHGWTEFAIPSAKRNRSECDGSSNPDLEEKCGRPLGLQMDKATGMLYIADAFFGLLSIGPRGGVATQVASSAEGQPFKLTNGVDVDQNTGIVYFTDSSTNYRRRDYTFAIITHDATGRLMSYNPQTKELKVLLKGVQFPNGIAVSDNGSFLIYSESPNQRVVRYWLRGPKAGTTDVFALLPGYPDNIKRTPEGEFWVAINTGSGKLDSDESLGPARKIMPRKKVVSDKSLLDSAVAVRLSKQGAALEVLSEGSATDSISEVVSHNGTLWLGSVVMPYVGLYNKP